MAYKASGDDDLQFRDMLAKIGRRIEDYSLEQLKYQCRDVIGPGRLEKVQTPQGLFELLEERDEMDIDNVDFLMKILQNIERVDLYKVVKDYSLSKSRLSMVESTRSGSPIVTPHNNAEKGYTSNSSKQDISVKKTADVANVDKECDNYTMPFDTSTDGDRIPLAHQHAGGYSTTPEFQQGLDFIISQISRGWQTAVRHLGVPDAVIEGAEYNWPRNVRTQVGEAFRYWARTDREASLQKLITALRCIHRNDLADRLQSNRF